MTFDPQINLLYNHICNIISKNLEGGILLKADKNYIINIRRQLHQIPEI